MPYGPLTKGGRETAAQDAKMERCVAQVMAQGKTKSHAIAICKVALRGKHKRS